MNLSPSAARIAILITELMVFLLATAAVTFFISYAGALEIAPGETAPAPFPVIAYDGDPGKPDPKNYFAVPWTDWSAVASKRGNASLLLPEKAGRLKLPDGSQAVFSSVPEGDGRQAVELNWVNDGGERHVRYVASRDSIEPRYYRSVSTNTFLVGAAVGFVAGLFVGRTLRRRWLPQPGFYAPAPVEKK